MRLLFDQNLSPSLVERLTDLAPGSSHVSRVGLGAAADDDVWTHAGARGLVIVTKDADFGELATTRGAPPKVLWIRLGNCTTAQVERAIRAHADEIRGLAADADSDDAVLTLLPPYSEA